MSLYTLIDNSRTDKNTCHSYLTIYDPLLKPKMLSAKNVLEVGILGGGSIKLWHDFFVNATIYGIDIMPVKNVWPAIKGNDRIRLFTRTNAYDPVFIKREFLDKGIKFDVLIDDGPHNIESMKQFIKLYVNLLTDDGVLIVEDLRSIDWIDILRAEVPAHLQQYIISHDLRKNKNRLDDILFIVNKAPTPVAAPAPAEELK